MKNLLLVLIVISLLSISNKNFAQAPDLRTVAPFTLFTTTGAVGNTGVSFVTSKIGTNNGAISGFTPVPGQEENANTVTDQAAVDLQTVYGELFNTLHTALHAAVLGNGETLFHGVYLISQASSINGILTLDAQNDLNAVFIFKINGAFAPGPASQILLTGGAQACNVYWAVEGGAIAIATLGDMKGTFIANPGAVSMAATSHLEGRLLSTTGAIAVDGIIVSLPPCVPLPVTLIEFKAAKTNNAVELTWKVDNEISFAGYELERSPDGSNFYSIGSVASTQNAFVKTYQWTDNSPLAPINYYRLKMIDIDSRFKYSAILKINTNGKKNISIYPNPVADHVIILQMYGQHKGRHFINIYNANGIKVMSSGIIQNENDGVRTIALDKNLQAGIYYLQLTDEGKNKESICFFVK
jgi:Ice-binding-like/Secretion system C-terminal sorting domain